MEKFLLYLPLGLLLGAGFVELTYRFVIKSLTLYLLSLPVKLFIWALLLYIFFMVGGIWNFFGGLAGFLLGFFSMIIVRGLRRNGRSENT
ncbi:MAG: hypothetical protein ACK4MW_07135 [Aquificaceae bacterium]